MKDFKGGNFKYYGKLFLKLIPTSIVLGILGGIVGSLFVLGVEGANHIWDKNKWLIYLLPLAGIVIISIYHIFGFKEPKGTNRIIEKVRDKEDVSILVAPVIFISTIITHIFGGSSGREGAAVQIGGSIGSGFSKILKFDNKDTALMVIAGVSGVFSALFGTPITAIFFSLEVISVGIIYYSGLIPCLISSLIAYMIGKNIFNIAYLNFGEIHFPNLNIYLLFKVVLIGVCAGILSSCFIMMLSKTSKLSKKYIKSSYYRIFIGGVLVICLTLIFSSGRYNGSSEEMLLDAFKGDIYYWDFLVKMIFTSITLGFGFKGGEIIPTFIIGATMGALLGGLLGISPEIAAAVGLIGTFCGAVNCPLASLILSIELFGSSGLIYFLGVSSISYLFSGYYSLYTSQKIVYSKVKAKYLNLSAKH